MANYRQIHTQIWTDNWFLELAPDEKLLFIYLFSNDKSSLSGLYEIHDKLISFETGMRMSRINTILNKFAESGKVYAQDGLIWIVNMQKYHTYKNESVKTRIEADIKAIPDCELKNKFLIHSGYTLSTDCGQSVLKEKEKEKEIENEITTTTPDSEIFKFGYVFQEITGIDPRWHADEIDAVEKIIKAGGTPDDYRNALLAMQEKDYTIGSMKSALNWTLKDLKARTNPKRRNNGGHKSLSPELDEILKDAPIFAEDYPK